MRETLWRICCSYCHKVLYTSNFRKEVDSITEEFDLWNILSFQRERTLEHMSVCPKFKENPVTYPRPVYVNQD